MSSVPPEILLQIASHFHVWSAHQTPSGEATRGIFKPKILLQLMQVCRAWYSILLPRLWERFDGQDPLQSRIPRYVILEYSHFIRDLYHPPTRKRCTNLEAAALSNISHLNQPFARCTVNNHLSNMKTKEFSKNGNAAPKPIDYTRPRYLPVRYDCTHLRTVHISHNVDQTVIQRLLRLNPYLVELSWGGGIQTQQNSNTFESVLSPRWPHLDLAMRTVLPIFPLYSLSRLTLRQWTTTSTLFHNILRHCAPTLVFLSLIDIRMYDPSTLSTNKRNPAIIKFAERSLTSIQFPKIKEMYLDISSRDSSPVILILVQSSPNLTKLTIGVRYLVPKDRYIDWMVQKIKSNCRHLRVLHLLQPTNFINQLYFTTTNTKAMDLKQWEICLDRKLFSSLNGLQELKIQISASTTFNFLTPFTRSNLGWNLERCEFVIDTEWVGYLGNNDVLARRLVDIHNVISRCPRLQWLKIHLSTCGGRRLPSDLCPGGARSRSMLLDLVPHRISVSLMREVAAWYRPRDLRQLHISGVDLSTFSISTSTDLRPRPILCNDGELFIKPLKNIIARMLHLELVTLNHVTFWTKESHYI